MKFNKISRKLAACSLAGVMMVSMLGMTVCAEGYTPDSSSVAVKFEKVLNMNAAEGASTPGVTFSYTIQPGTAVTATDTTPEIKAGVGAPTIEDVTYEVGDDEFTKTATVDFSKVTFTAPGIYRYEIKEDNTKTNGIYENIGYDTPTRYLDVYVENVLKDGKVTGYKITNSVLTETAINPTQKGDQVEYGENKKVAGYENTYTTYDLTLDKTLAGTMANHADEFKFTITIKGMQAGSTVTVEEGDDTFTSSAAKEDGTITVSATLGDKGSTTIKGIPANASYEIKENLDAKTGYTPSIKTTTGLNVNKSEDVNGGYSKVTAEMDNKDEAVSYTNTKDAVTPTGVAMTVAPYILMVAVAGVFAILFLRRRHEEV